MSKKEMIIKEILKKSETQKHSAEIEKALSGLKKDNVDKTTIYIGAGTCGLGAGAGKTLQAVNQYIDEHKLDAEVIQVGCIGLCSAEPLMDVKIPGKNRISFQNVTAAKASKILDEILQENIPGENILAQFKQAEQKEWKNVPYLNEHFFFAPQKRLVLENCGIIDPVSIEEYIARGGYRALLNTLKTMEPYEVCELIEKSGLRGRGGGGFPTGKKWKMALANEAGQKYLVCNADEGDPGAFMDRAVIEGDPHKLIEGMAIGAFAIDATKAYVYIRAEYPLAIQRLVKAIEKAKEYGLLGKNIYGSGFDLELVIKKGAGAFVCGEETALLHSIEGRRGMPRPRPPYPSDSGLFGKPTIINNVETFSNVAGIINRGAEWFSSMGTEKSKGTKVFALSGRIANTGLIEIPMGTTIRDIIYKIGGGIPENKKFKSVQMGGPSGGCVTEKNLDIEIDYDSLLNVGAMMGSGGMVVMDETTCMVDIAIYFMDFIQRESCGKMYSLPRRYTAHAGDTRKHCHQTYQWQRTRYFASL
ncbi:MAG: SLBB domain-containing protein [Bacteroidota bacterium]|nr:SLBB domain-containing protein [Bacteroidota bacterium]